MSFAIKKQVREIKKQVGAVRRALLRRPMPWSDDVLYDEFNWPNHGKYLRACDEAYKEMARISDFNEFTADVPTVVCVARNEEERLPTFIDHYIKLGVRSIHVVDNDSSDRTAEIASSYSNVTLWKTSSSYARAAFGQKWVGALARRFGINRWVLNVDADELLVFDGMETKGLSDFQNWVSDSGAERVYTPMIDVYTDPDQNGHEVDGGRVKILFDGRVVNGCSPYTRERLPFGPHLVGGPRMRIMASIDEKRIFWLDKFALARWDAETAYANVHYPYPFGRNPRDCFAALLHIKFLGDFASRVNNAVLEQQHWNGAAEYKSYQRWLTSSRDSLISEYTTGYLGPQSLLAAGIIDKVPWKSSI
jgi:glycosyltransferase involved in cell wall biosynthesis